MSEETRPKARSGVVLPHRLKWHQRLAASLIYALVRTVSATIRYEWRDGSGMLARTAAAGEPLIFCIWHNRLALCLEIYRLYVKKVGGNRKLAAMVSASKDGGILARVLEHYQVQPARGSTSRRGRQALLELTTLAGRGHDLAITPDGPRGPCYVIQEGVLSLAQITGLAIIPTAYSLSFKVRAGSWDRFQIPLPFSKCVVVFDQPVRVPRDATDAQREELRRRLEDRLRQLTED